jgi:hypothetical protein
MAVICLQRVALADGVTEAEFLVADALLQSHAHAHWAGLRRRTVARGAEGYLIECWFASGGQCSVVTSDDAESAVTWRSLLADGADRCESYATIE